MEIVAELLKHSTEILLIIVSAMLTHATYRAAREEHRHSEKVQQETTDIVEAVLDHVTKDKPWVSYANETQWAHRHDVGYPLSDNER